MLFHRASMHRPVSHRVLALYRLVDDFGTMTSFDASDLVRFDRAKWGISVLSSSMCGHQCLSVRLVSGRKLLFLWIGVSEEQSMLRHRGSGDDQYRVVDPDRM